MSPVPPRPTAVRRDAWGGPLPGRSAHTCTAYLDAVAAGARPPLGLAAYTGAAWAASHRAPQGGRGRR